MPTLAQYRIAAFIRAFTPAITVSEVLRDYQYDIRTESAYVRLIRLYIMFQAKRHPERMGKAEAVAFLSLRSGA